MIPQTFSFVAVGFFLFGLAATAAQIPAPDDVAAAPSDAQTTSSVPLLRTPHHLISVIPSAVGLALPLSPDDLLAELGRS